MSGRQNQVYGLRKTKHTGELYDTNWLGYAIVMASHIIIYMMNKKPLHTLS